MAFDLVFGALAGESLTYWGMMLATAAIGFLRGSRGAVLGKRKRLGYVCARTSTSEHLGGPPPSKSTRAGDRMAAVWVARAL